MGSGLILLVIVAAWLAVLVPMALRSQESNPMGTVEKFHDAMRVLSRRGGSAGVGSDVAGSAEQAAGAGRVVGRPVEGRSDGGRPAGRPGGRLDVVRRVVVRSLTDAAPTRAGRSPAAQRRRVLLALVVVAALTLVGALVGPRWLFAPHLMADLMIGAYVGYLRHETILRAEREWRTARGERRPAGPGQGVSPAEQASRQAPRANSARANSARAGSAPTQVSREAAAEATGEVVRRVTRPAHIAGVPDSLPSRATVTGERPVVMVDRTGGPEPVPARGAQGGVWSPVPVPLPIYLSEPAPRRKTSDGLAAAERELGIDDQGPELEQILDRRRAVND